LNTHDEGDWLPTRRSLLSRLRAWDDQESWSLFYETYGRLLFSYARRAGLDPAEAEDVVQDTVVSVARELPGFRYDPARGSFKGWLHQIVRRRVVDHLRRLPRECVTDAEEPTPAPERAEDSGWDVLWQGEWARHVTARALERVKGQVASRQFQIFSLAVLQEQPVPRVCEALGVSAAAVYLAKHRVGRLFRAEVRRLESEEPI
jgi:RNA polymerase sigma-70 factor (ECF subfamily)